MKLKLTVPWQVFLVALLLRLTSVLLTRSLGIGLDDMFQYDMLARSLASGNGYRWYAYEDLQMLEPYVHFDLSTIDYDPQRGVLTSFRPPLYPALLALIYLVMGAGAGRFFAVRLVQAGLGALLAPLTYHTSCRLFPDNRPAAVISAWIVALYPMLIAFPLALATENLFILLLLASFLLLLKTLEKPTSLHFLLTGILLGLTALTRSVILIFCGFALVWLCFALKGQRRKVMLAFLAFTFTILPWMVRNSRLNQHLSGIETALGYQLYVGYHPDSTGTFLFGVSLDLVPILDDNLRDQVGTEKALEFIRQDPARVVKLVLNRLGYFFGLERRALTYFYANDFFGFIPLPLLLGIAGIFLLPFVVVATSAVLGLALARLRPPIILLLLLILGYLLPHLLIISEERFHIALVPLLAVLAAQFWMGSPRAFAARWNESLAGKITLSLAVLAIVLLCLNWGFELFHDADKIATLLSPGGNQVYFPY